MLSTIALLNNFITIINDFCSLSCHIIYYEHAEVVDSCYNRVAQTECVGDRRVGTKRRLSAYVINARENAGQTDTQGQTPDRCFALTAMEAVCVTKNVLYACVFKF